MSDLIRRLRIFVSCPGDVGDERNVLEEAIRFVNDTVGESRGTQIKSWQWKDNVIPQVGPKPQDVVDGQLPAYDVYLGIMSSRFGTSTERHGSGTEKEFRDAFERWGQTGSPWIAFYFDQSPMLSGEPEDAEQYVDVCKFRKELEGKGIVTKYSATRGGPTGFYELVTKHLTNLVERWNDPTLDRTSITNIQDPAPIPAAYLTWLKQKCADIDLLGLKSEKGQAVQLSHVYVPLVTTITGFRDTREPSFRLLLTLLNESSLYVPGAPGSGKSTFCRWVAWLACACTMPKQVLKWPSKYQDYEETFPNNLAKRLPLLVRLRDFWECLPHSNGLALSATQLTEALAHWVKVKIPDLESATLQAHLDAGTALLILDGVDEVPLTREQGGTQSHPRELLLSGLIDAIPRWTKAGNRVLLTSRPYGLDSRHRQGLTLPQAPIGALTRVLASALIQRWFGLLRGDQGEAWANELYGETSGRPELSDLMANPMLLTALCVIFNQGKRIPQERYELYDRIVDNVLHNRFQGTAIAKARGRLSVIAHGMHTGAGLDEERGTPHAEATHVEIERMLKAYQQGRRGTQAELESAVDARDRLLSESGLLLPRDGDRAAFYHLTFQDFFAACWLEDQARDALPALFFQRAAMPEWHSTLSFVFGAVLAHGALPDRGIRLLGDIIQGLNDDTVGLGVVVGECLQILTHRGHRLAKDLEARFCEFCLKAIVSEASVEDRWSLGLALGRIGDPRIVMDLRKPEGYIEVPAGEYWVGHEEEKDNPCRTHRVERSFLLSRYPVTNGQYGLFMEEGGYENQQWWSQEGQAWLEQQGKREPEYWKDPRRNEANQPVVGVCYWEAEAFARWAGGYIPGEYDWEAAAGGQSGRQYPWGEDWEEGICNSFGVGHDRSSPIGIFPRSRTPEGFEDMGGNVWEWTASDYGGGAGRVIRGGSWVSHARLVRCACRDRYAQDDRSDSLGFRCARVQAKKSK